MTPLRAIVTKAGTGPPRQRLGLVIFVTIVKLFSSLPFFFFFYLHLMGFMLSF